MPCSKMSSMLVLTRLRLILKEGYQICCEEQSCRSHLSIIRLYVFISWSHLLFISLVSFASRVKQLNLEGVTFKLRVTNTRVTNLISHNIHVPFLLLIGHKSYELNMISGASQTDSGVQQASRPWRCTINNGVCWHEERWTEQQEQRLCEHK
ncbi:PREDICTED: uncharacterized protein LOC104723731 isoform X1 [Camelina sativa]|uniref:Uncharacterized protein LOC104723731 isoform X1 n=1 Tax=Camelina sativa TaxID=90675 RepID=A0ABM1QJX7_CAMSA|nr:PREDICTED: uncharacterized protein LOC104723731 isoform X1 [Camelina sativa]